MRAITMTPELANRMADEFFSNLMKLDKIDRKQMSYTQMFEVSQPNAVTVNFTIEAYEQMYALVNHFDCEVAWHGLAHRVDDTHFQITKILLYPQDVDSVTVTTDQVGYSNWLNDRSDEEFNSIRFQGHSHVNMGTSPSGLDESKQWDIIKDLDETDFYVFVIVNKRHEYHIWVVDKAKNAVYTEKDVNVTIGTFDKNEFLKDADTLVKKVVHNYYPPVAKPKKAVAATKTAEPKKPKKEKNSSNLADYYKKHPGQLSKGNSSCYPYDEAVDDYYGYTQYNEVN